MLTLLYVGAVLVLLVIAGCSIIQAVMVSRAKRQDDLLFSSSIDRGQRYIVRKKLPGGHENYGWVDDIEEAREMAEIAKSMFNDIPVEIYDRTNGAVESIGWLRVIK